MAFFTKKKTAPGASPADVLTALSKVMDPDLGKDLVTLNMIRNVSVSEGAVGLDLVLTTPACPMKNQMKAAVEEAVRALPRVSSVEVRVSADVRAAKDPAEGKRRIPGVRNVDAVAPGTGGVGKSTISANLAVALARAGARVGLLDADIYGPSVPTLFHLKGHRLAGEDDKILPAESHGLKIVSIGFLLEDDTPIIWRGPMLMKALEQFLHGTKWGELDYLVIDLPPGTGDVQISLVQMTPVAGAVVVTTPQDLALIDVKKAVRMFEKVGVPILGVVENMSYFLCPQCGTRTDIFSHGGARHEAERLGVPFLGEVPLHMTIREKSDAGLPVVATEPDGPHAKIYREIAGKVLAQLKGGADAGRVAPKIVIEA